MLLVTIGVIIVFLLFFAATIAAIMVEVFVRGKAELEVLEDFPED